MNNNYKFTLYVELPQSMDRLATAFEVEAYCAPELKPYDRCSDSLTASLFSGVTHLGAARIDADRRRLAEEIAHKMTEAMLEAIKARDLENGYAKEKKAQLR